EQAAFNSSTKAFDGNWHTYGLRWTPTFWTAYVDGVETGKFPVNQSLMKKPVYPIIDLAVSPLSTASTAPASYTMYVDYVRVYTCTSMVCQNG
ncbi:MAG TPA: family 16 glycosylhydrolase, partial [Caulobacteraceae bacterium]|nr:family 16 glycosylhydrolase [Caulobacteraceae bacterium]